MVQARAPARLIEGGLPTEQMVAHFVVAKYAHHSYPEPPIAMKVWSYLRDEGWPVGTGDQELVPNHRELLS